MKHLRLSSHQSQQMLSALILTSVLSLGSNIVFVNATAAEPVGNSPEVTVEAREQRLVYSSKANVSQSTLNEKASTIRDAKLPNVVASAVLREASQHSGLRPSELHIVESKQIQGSSSCLGIPPSFNELCTADLALLWQVAVEGGQQRLVYHTNMNGSRIRLNDTNLFIKNVFNLLTLGFAVVITSSIASYIFWKRRHQFR